MGIADEAMLLIRWERKEGTKVLAILHSSALEVCNASTNCTNTAAVFTVCCPISMPLLNLLFGQNTLLKLFGDV
uniref:Uncharacterized protein n=1 Tax=Panagrellus redivivus TaxID=6233 RepID=A0A7E4VNF7_PANRE